jgi:hypothetical protein
VSRECVQEIGTGQGHPHSGIAWRCLALSGLEGESKTLDRLSLPCPLTGIEEGV